MKENIQLGARSRQVNNGKIKCKQIDSSIISAASWLTMTAELVGKKKKYKKPRSVST